MSNNINNNSINLGLKMLTILAFGFIFIPFNHAAAQVAVMGCGEGGCNSSWGSPSYAYSNPVPSSSCNYDSCNTNINNYYNNGNQQPYQQSYQVSYVPPVQSNIIYNPTPVMPTNIVYSTSINPNPTPVVTRVITRTTTTPSSTTQPTNSSNNNGGTNANGSTNGTTGNGNNASDLASNAIFGSSGFLPSGLVQWILFGIFILIIIILTRRIFGAKEAYEEKPMKYE